jgi:hypothetical protein
MWEYEIEVRRKKGLLKKLGRKKKHAHKQSKETRTGDGRLVLLGDCLAINELCKHPLADFAGRQDGVDGDGTFRGKCETWIIGIRERERERHPISLLTVVLLESYRSE